MTSPVVGRIDGFLLSQEGRLGNQSTLPDLIENRFVWLANTPWQG